MTNEQLAAEIDQLRQDVIELRAQLQALQAEQLRATVTGVGDQRWTWPTRIGPTGLIAPVMGSVNAPVWYWGEEELNDLDEDELYD